jgi:hypothetical protein
MNDVYFDGLKKKLQALGEEDPDEKSDWTGSVHDMATYLLSRMHKDLLSKENIGLLYALSSEAHDEHSIMSYPDGGLTEARDQVLLRGCRYITGRVMPDRQPSSKK